MQWCNRRARSTLSPHLTLSHPAFLKHLAAWKSNLTIIRLSDTGNVTVLACRIAQRLQPRTELGESQAGPVWRQGCFGLQPRRYQRSCMRSLRKASICPIARFPWNLLRALPCMYQYVVLIRLAESEAWNSSEKARNMPCRSCHTIKMSDNTRTSQALPLAPLADFQNDQRAATTISS